MTKTLKDGKVSPNVHGEDEHASLEDKLTQSTVEGQWQLEPRALGGVGRT